MLKFKKSLTISGLIVICISGCQQLAVPDFKKNRTTFVVPVEVVDKTKFGLQSKFSITIKSNSSNKKYTYLITPSPNIKYKLITDLPPGKYTLEKYELRGWEKVEEIRIDVMKEFGEEKLAKFKHQLNYLEIGSAPMPLQHKEKLMELLPSLNMLKTLF